jgi:hypothetical protein
VLELNIITPERIKRSARETQKGMRDKKASALQRMHNLENVAKNMKNI